MFLGRGHTNLSDEELLQRYKAHPAQPLLGELFVRYSDLLYGVCLKYLKDREAAKDAVMTIFESLPGKLQQHHIERFRGWIYVTARNHCLMHLRSAKNTQEFSIRHVEIDPGMNLPDEETLEDNLGKLEKCIEKLNGEQRECVKLFFLREQSYSQIAEQTGYDLKQVKSYIQNGKRNLKICMEQRE